MSRVLPDPREHIEALLRAIPNANEAFRALKGGQVRRLEDGRYIWIKNEPGHARTSS
jgi:hypothetical protein